jgi:hypothetical protein
MTTEASPPQLVPSHPTGSTFLVGVEVLLWTLYLVAFIMVMVVVMMT